jgi:hypothetical protein
MLSIGNMLEDVSGYDCIVLCLRLRILVAGDPRTHNSYSGFIFVDKITHHHGKTYSESYVLFYNHDIYICTILTSLRLFRLQIPFDNFVKPGTIWVRCRQTR